MKRCTLMHILSPLTLQNEGIADQIAGQCTCKTNVVGIKCADCKVGFFDLRADRPEGCLPCDCNTAGKTEEENCIVRK